MAAEATAAAAAPALRQSRTGKRPIELPKGVTARVAGELLEIKGPKGTLSRKIPPNVKVSVDGARLAVAPTIEGRDGARYQGLARAVFAAAVQGASAGYVQELELVGTGYRAEVKGSALTLALGFSHPVNLQLPTGITARVPAESKGTLIILEGSDKEVMGQLAAKIRDLRPPEPYGGKGVRYKGEKVRQKAGKSGGKGK